MNKDTFRGLIAGILIMGLLFTSIPVSADTGATLSDRIVAAITGNNINTKLDTLHNDIVNLTAAVNNSGEDDINTTINTGLTTISNSIKNIQSSASGGSSGSDVIKPSIRVTALDAGTITVTDGVHTYTQKLEEPGNAVFPNIQSFGDFTITLTDNGQTFTKNITITETVVYRVTIGFPTLAVTAHGDGKLTITDGVFTYNKDVNAEEEAIFRLESFEEYKILLENDNGCGESTIEILEFKPYATEISIFSANISVNCFMPSGSGTLTATSADGKYIYTKQCESGNTDITVHANRIYTFDIEQDGNEGEIISTKNINEDGGTYTAYAGFASELPHDYSGIEWETVSAKSHININTGLATGWTNIVEVNGKGLFLGAYNHTWYNYVSGGTPVQYQFLIDGEVIDDVTIQRYNYDHENIWGHNFNDGDQNIYAPRKRSYSSVQNISSSNTTINAGILREIGSPARLFEHSLVIRAKRAGTTDNSDSIYTFDAAILRLDQ